MTASPSESLSLSLHLSLFLVLSAISGNQVCMYVAHCRAQVSRSLCKSPLAITAEVLLRGKKINFPQASAFHDQSKLNSDSLQLEAGKSKGILLPEWF